MGHIDVHKPLASLPDPAIVTFPAQYTVSGGQLDARVKLNKQIGAFNGLRLQVLDATNSRVRARDIVQDEISSETYTSLQLDLSGLPNGIYVYEIVDATGLSLAAAQFCLIGSARSRVGLLHPFFTWHAYCAEGGDSFYKGAQFDETRVIELSLHRPLQGLSRCHDPSSLRNMSVLLDREDVAHTSFCSQHFHRNPEILEDFDVLVMAGHDEYWTHAQFDALEAFIKRGGHVANFSANVLCWAVDAQDDKIRVDKRNTFEPGISHARSSGQFRSPWINRPQQRLFGLNYFSAGYPTKRVPKAKASAILSEAEYDTSDKIEVIARDHPIFEDIEIDKGVLQTTGDSLLDVEVDGVFLNGTEVDRLRTTDVARDTKVLAKALVNVAYARPDQLGRLNTDLWFETVGIMAECVPFDGGGTTIQIGSVGWYKAAKRPGSNEARLTTNTIKYLLGKQNEQMDV
ncbi:MAG: hypothetical protein OXC60_08435 [Litoreibacter sp.]|nr:hypothetical protein [Litoreibacter sp.]